VSSYFPDDEYEARLVAATKARELPLKQLSWREGNPKRVREHLELRALSGSLMEWKQYITWELKAKKPQRKFIMAVYERAVECAARERWDALCQARDAPNDEAVGVVLKTKDDNLKEMWEEYLVYAVCIYSDSRRTDTYLRRLVVAGEQRRPSAIAWLGSSRCTISTRLWGKLGVIYAVCGKGHQTNR
jgi:hypothetical protein